MAERFVVRCSGVRANGRRCTVMVDARSDEGKHFCFHPECRRSYFRDYARRPEAKALNRERVKRRRARPEVRAKEAAAQRERVARKRLAAAGVA